MSNEPKAPKDDNIGYGKPPKATRFKKGQSGNPKGRPKGSRSIVSIVKSAANKRLTLTINGQSRVVTRKDAAADQLTLGAAKGNRHDRREMFHWLEKDEAKRQLKEASVSSAHDEETFEGVLMRLNSMRKKPKPDGESE